jgi:hypothetical protein
MSFDRITALTALIVASASLNATSIPNLLHTATAVVVGTESSETQQGRTIFFKLMVERSFTGPLATGQMIQVQSDPEGRPVVPGDVAAPIRGIWFLRQAANGGWLCIPAAHSGNGRVSFRELPYPISNATLPAALAYDDKATALADKLVLEVAAANSTNPGLLVNAASGLNSPAAQRALRFSAAGNQGVNSLVALAGLIEGGDAAAVQQVEMQAASLKNNGASGGLISAISLFRNPDPAAVASLGRIALAVGNAPELRLAAAQSLAAIHCAAAVPLLGAMLSDASPQMQVAGARGLSFFANGVGIPTADTMRTLNHLNQRQPSSYANAETEENLGYAPGHEAAFIQYWTRWWGQHPELHFAN